MSNAFAPRGTEVQHSSDGVTYTTIAEVSKAENTGSKADTADVTNFDSTSGFREFLSTLSDSGEFAIECNFIPGNATQQVLETDFNNQTLGYYKVVLPNSLGNSTFRAIVASRDFMLPIDKQGTRAIKLKISGIMTNTW
jgi:predicted secreted protein